jgi:hypothetical protein
MIDNRHWQLIKQLKVRKVHLMIKLNNIWKSFMKIHKNKLKQWVQYLNKN